MEHAPLLPNAERDSETKESKKPSKKNAESIGAMLVEQKPQKEEPKNPLFSLFERGDKKSEVPLDHRGEDAEAELPSAEINEADEQHAPLEHLSAEERQMAVEAIVAENVEHEHVLALEDEAEQAGEAAVAAFHEAILEDGQDLESAEAATIERLEAASATGAEELTETAESEVTHTLEITELHITESTAEGPLEFTDDVAIELNTTTVELDDSEEDEATPPTTVAGLAGVAADAMHAAGHGGGRPPVPPRPPVGGAGMPPVPPHGPRGTAGFAAAPAPGFTPTVAPVSAPERIIVDHGNEAVAALLGGIIGYFIGRRRGRIKTEKRLKPIQKKLQNEVAALHEQVQQKEDRIRMLATEKARGGQLHAEQLKATQKRVAKSERPNQLRQHLEREPDVVERIITARTAEQKLKTTFTERRPIVEARVPRASQERPSKLGHVVMAAEAPALAAKQERAAEKQPAKLEKSFEMMNRNELLKTAERIIVDGASLRQIYETRLVGERGLRRLVQEHLRGGDVKKALRREIIEREIDFERDPVMRDQLVHDGADAVGGGTQASSPRLKELLKHTEVANDTNSEEVAFLKARAAYEVKEQAAAEHKRRVMDVSLITTIAVLTTFVVILLARGR